VPATPLSRLSTETRDNLSTGEITHILSPATKNSRSILTPEALLADLELALSATAGGRCSFVYVCEGAINGENPLNQCQLLAK
jgi:hypothetical protein